MKKLIFISLQLLLAVSFLQAQNIPVDSLNACINNACNYFNIKGENITNPDVIYKLDQYKQAHKLKLSTPDFYKYPNMNNGSVMFFDLLNKINFFQMSLLPMEYEKIAKVNKIMYHELYCVYNQNTALPPDFATELFNYSRPGGYYLYYTAMQYYTLMDRGLIRENETNLNYWKVMLNDLIIQHTYPDLVGCTEGMNFNMTTYVLIKTKHESLIDDAQIRRIMQAQLSDGTWSMTNDMMGDDVSTLYGLLALYEYKSLYYK